MRKEINLEQSHIEIMEKVKKQIGVKKNSDVIKYVLEEYEKNDQKKEESKEFIEELLTTYEKKYNALFTRLRWASQTAEMNTTLLLDAMNTILLLNDINDGILIDSIKSPVLEISQAAYKSKIAHFKQMKDDRKLKEETRK